MLYPWANCVVPFPVKPVTFQVDAVEFFFRHFDLERIFRCIQLCFHLEASPRRCGTDEVDNDFMAYQRAASPIHGDMRKQAMFNLVPFTRS